MTRRSIFKLLAAATFAAAVEVAGLAPKAVDINALREAFVQGTVDRWETRSIAAFYQLHKTPAP